jgi:hypothetical protein
MHPEAVRLKTAGKKPLDPEPPPSQKGDAPQDTRSSFYSHDERGISYFKSTKDGPVKTYLNNFTASLTEIITKDDGAGDPGIFYRVTGARESRRYPEITIPASRFGSLQWLDQWGPTARVHVGNLAREHIVNAIKECSEQSAIERTIYSHTGWRKLGTGWAYLHAGGAVGAVAGVDVELARELTRYTLPDRKDRKDLSSAVGGSLAFLDVAPKAVTIPLLSAVYLAPLTSFLKPRPGFSLFLHGESGTMKTTLSLVALAHYGDFVTADDLSNFSDTANALERRAFTLKDTLMLVDDYHPSASPHEANEKERVLQRLVRAAGNRTGRARLNSDATEKGRCEPRSLLLITGEDLPGVQSTIARVVVLDIARGAVDQTRLSALQADAGQLPTAMAGYLNWLRPDLDTLTNRARVIMIERRALAINAGFHARVVESVATLYVGWSMFLDFAVAHDALSPDQREEHLSEGWELLCTLAQRQADRIQAEDPAQRFVAILNALLTTGKVAFREPLPDDRLSAAPIGERDGDAVNLLPTPTWHAIKEYCRSEGTAFPVSPRAATKMLEARGWLFTNPDDDHRQDRRVVFGRRQRVLRMPIALFTKDENDAG